MDLTFLIDILGDSAAQAMTGLVVGLGFGAFAQRSRFCLRSAVIEFSRGTIGAKVAIWLLAFGAAVGGTQALIALGLLDVTEVRQLAARGTLSGALVGGALFGVGMILARGCASRLLVLSANGNLRALTSGLILTVAAQASLRGILSPAREGIAGLWTIEGGAPRDLLFHLGGIPYLGLAIGLACIGAALFFALRNRVPLGQGLAALGVGVMVALGWFLTYCLAGQSFDPVPVQSVSFTGPSADTLMALINAPQLELTFTVGLVPGVFVGSFLAAALGGELKLEGFQGGVSMTRYILGAVMMGFGGMLAGGCAVGAGVTGGAVFSLTAWVALTAMWVSAGLTDYLVDRGPMRRGRNGLKALSPAE